MKEKIMGRKLLIISQRFWPEECDINTMAKNFAAEGVHVDVLCGKPNCPEGFFYEGYSAFGGRREEHFGGINIFRAAELKLMGFFQKRPLVNYVSFRISSVFRIRKLKKNQYDAVFIYQTSPVFQGAAGLRLAHKRGIRSVMYINDLWPDAIYKELNIRDPLLRKIFRAVSYKNYKKANRLITCSKEAERFIKKEIAESPGNAPYIAPFASEAFRPGVKDDRIMQRFIGSFNLLYIGPVEPDGPFDMFTEAAQKIIGAGLRDIRFIIAGDGEGLPELKKKIDRLFLYDTVFLEGKVSPEKLPGYIYAADALICAEKIDVSVSYKPAKQVIDYLGAAKPVIAAAGTEGREIIKKAGCGLVSEPEDAAGFFENILTLYKTPKDSLRKMGANALAYQQRNFNAKTVCSRILDVIFPEEE